MVAAKGVSYIHDLSGDHGEVFGDDHCMAGSSCLVQMYISRFFWLRCGAD